jgi:uncharacterized repeat protein (TIGR01451 family)
MGKRLGAPIGAIVGLVLVCPGSAAAATFDVDSTPDATHVGGCTPAPDDCSLRDAVAAVNLSADAANTINVPEGTYPITAGQLELAPATGDTTMIAGGGARSTTLDAGGASRVFVISDSDTTISGVTISGILVDAVAAGQEPSLTLVDSTVTGNTAAVQGGGVAAASFHTPLTPTISFPLTIVRSTIRNNRLTGGTPPVAAIGGGINTFGDLTVTNSTITGNTVDSPALVNMGGGVGAGLDPTSITATTVSIVNSTISGNAVTGAPTSAGGGLAISSVSPTVAMSVTNTIIQGNTVNGAQSECSGVVAPTSANNLTGDATCLFTDAGSFQGDPLLGALANNGGPTDTLLPAEASPTIDAGTGTGCPATDQRGVARPQRSACDIGAVEVVPLPPPPTPEPPGPEPPATPPSADLAVSLTARPPAPNLGDKVRFTFAATNAGPDAATNTVLTGKLPAPASRVVPPDGCTVTRFKPSPVPKRRLSCQLGTVASGATVTRTAKVKPKPRTSMPRATVQVTSEVVDPQPANNVTKLKVDVAD